MGPGLSKVSGPLLGAYPFLTEGACELCLLTILTYV